MTVLGKSGICSRMAHWWSQEKDIKIGSVELISIQLDHILLLLLETRPSRFGISRIHAALLLLQNISSLSGLSNSMTLEISYWALRWIHRLSYSIYEAKKWDRVTAATLTQSIMCNSSLTQTSSLVRQETRLFQFGTWEPLSLYRPSTGIWVQ